MIRCYHEQHIILPTQFFPSWSGNRTIVYNPYHFFILMHGYNLHFPMLMTILYLFRHIHPLSNNKYAYHNHDIYIEYERRISAYLSSVSNLTLFPFLPEITRSSTSGIFLTFFKGGISAYCRRAW